MSMTDPIADLLTRMRNASRQHFEFTDVPASKLKQEILKLLKKEGYIRNYAVRKRKSGSVIKVFLKYTPEGEPAFEKITRVSKPGRRTYVGKDEMPVVAGGMGTSVISTPRGLLTSQESRKRGLGGEIMFNIQ
jgi:small subunit ribosomal protein S8